VLILLHSESELHLGCGRCGLELVLVGQASRASQLGLQLLALLTGLRLGCLKLATQSLDLSLHPQLVQLLQLLHLRQLLLAQAWRGVGPLGEKRL